MIFTSVYVIIDGFFVSNFVGKTSFAAINIIIPAVLTISAFGYMFGSGGTALVAFFLGQKKSHKANETFSLITYSAFIIGIVLTVIMFIFMEPLSIALGADGELLQDCIVYGQILVVAEPFLILQVMFQSFFIAAEKSKLGLMVNVAAGLTNMILDAVLVLGLPMEYKLAGAAIASAASQVVGGIIPVIYFARKNTSLLKLGKTHFDKKSLFKASTNGLSEFLANMSLSLVSLLFNIQLLRLSGETGVAAFGILMYVSMIYTAIFFGYTMGTSPIISFHFGANNNSELKSLLRKNNIILIITGILMAVAGEIFAGPVSYMFGGYDPALYDLTVCGFRIFSISFIFMGFNVNVSAFFTALNNGIVSGVYSFLRLFVFQCVAVLTLPIIFGIDGIWWSLVVAEAISTVVGIVILIKKRSKYNY